MPKTSDTLSILEDNLKTNILLYAPEIKHSENQEPAPVVYFDDHLPFNKVALVVTPGEFRDIHFEKPDLTGVSTKNILLRDNLFILMDAKNELSPDQFILLAEEYAKVLKSVLDYTIDAIYSLKGNFKNNLPEKILLGFETQSRFLEDHYLEFEKRFGIEASLEEENEDIEHLKLNGQGSKILDKNPDDKPKQTLTLKDYITHPEREEIEKIIVENFTTEKGRSIRCILEYLNNINILPIGYGKKNILLACLKNTFKRDIGVYSSIWEEKKIDPLSDRTYIDLKKSLNKLLENVLNKKLP
jgi:hypothetical protein